MLRVICSEVFVIQVVSYELKYREIVMQSENCFLAIRYDWIYHYLGD